MGTINVTLGGKSWAIRPLTLGQIKEIEPVLADKMTGSADKASKVIKIALQRDDPATATALDDVETTVLELAAASASILELSGFLKRKPAAGEEQAPAANGAE